jgi:hypothetical protein
MGPSRYGIKVLLLCLTGMGIGIVPVSADTTISMPSPPISMNSSGSVVMSMVTQARAAAMSAMSGSEALQRYVQHRQFPSHVYSIEPRRPQRRGGDRYDEYMRDWGRSYGPRIWGTWYPWGGFWGGGCTVWTIGYPGDHGANFSVGGQGGFTFANLGGGS